MLLWTKPHPKIKTSKNSWNPSPPTPPLRPATRLTSPLNLLIRKRLSKKCVTNVIIIERIPIKKQIVAGRITMAITAFIFVIVLAVSFFRCGNSDCRTGGFEVLLLAPIFCLFFLAGLITVIVNTVLYNARKNKSEKIDSGISQSPQPVHAEKSSASIFKGAGGILAIIGVIIMCYAILVGGNNIIPMLIAVSLFLVAALLVSIGHNKDK